MFIAICSKISEEKHLTLTRSVINFFKEQSIDVAVEESIAKHFDVPAFSKDNLSKITTLITLGGDGSILRAAHRYHNINAPILGINLGSLGFMADVPAENIHLYLSDLLKGDYSVQKRLVLKGELSGKMPFSSFNDIVLHRANNSSLITLGVYIKGNLLSLFQSDGLIFSTPNGSTAYSLAAGGPIISPTVEGYLLTPICAHTISNRPIVLHPSEEVTIQVMKKTSSPIEVINDGYEKYALNEGDTLTIKRAEETFDLIKLNRIDYFSTLRTKLGWSGTLT
ncbi:NAD(+) kinase [Candidatus Aerophobetes bacterium]|uniref:NAD kinase n=1 Tax=Aerophobetes bacterium TaxID=2030807 RepID=A0A2A4X9I7_UNCAE|nr:MAG: NAD(+) kinase [Candidatus Aerophobetes bacterium]